MDYKWTEYIISGQNTQVQVYRCNCIIHYTIYTTAPFPWKWGNYIIIALSDRIWHDQQK